MDLETTLQTWADVDYGVWLGGILLVIVIAEIITIKGMLILATWVLTAPSMGSTVGAIVGKAKVAEGRGVNVGNSVAVAKGSGVGLEVAAGVEVTAGAQPANSTSMKERRRYLRMP